MPTPTRSPAAISATSSRTPQPRKLFETSRYALASSPDGLPGEWGGIALKAFPTRVNGDRIDIKVGEVIPAEVSRSWPVTNRMAMSSQRFVRYFETAKEAEKAAVALSGQAIANPERAMMAAEAASEKHRAPHLTATAIAAAQKKRKATLAAKKAAKEATAAKVTAPAPVVAADAAQPAA